MNTFEIKPTTVTTTVSATGEAVKGQQVKSPLAFDGKSVVVGTVFHGQGDLHGYVTKDGRESASWYVSKEFAAQCLASKGNRGHGAGKGRPSQRWAIVAKMVTRKGGATREEIVAAIKESVAPVMNPASIAGIIGCLRRGVGGRAPMTISHDRTTGRYSAA